MRNYIGIEQNEDYYHLALSNIDAARTRPVQRKLI